MENKTFQIMYDMRNRTPSSFVIVRLRRDEIMGNVLVVNNAHISVLFQFAEESFLYFYFAGHNGIPRIIKTIQIIGC
jgi:hypothetical protein